jgi:hypothetical protein
MDWLHGSNGINWPNRNDGLDRMDWHNGLYRRNGYDGWDWMDWMLGSNGLYR